MSIIDTLITNRTSAGFYGIADLNRVGEAMCYVAERLRDCGIAITVSPKTDWKLTDQATRAAATRYLANLKLVREALATSAATPSLPGDKTPFTTKEANDIERILEDVDKLITNMMQAYRHSGMIVAGQGGLIL